MPLLQGIPCPLPMHVTIRTFTRFAFGPSIEKTWEILGLALAGVQEKHLLDVHAALLMSNHVHLILTPYDRESDLLKAIGAEFESQLRSNFGLTSPFFRLETTGYVIRHALYFGRALKYVYRNPVLAKLCETVEAYPYSTVQYLLGNAELRFALRETYFNRVVVPADRLEFLRWLNTGM